VEVDVWGAHHNFLRVGHDRPEIWWEIPKSEFSKQVFLHLKSQETVQNMRITLAKQGWTNMQIFISPLHPYCGLSGTLTVVTQREQIDVNAIEQGAWLEQPDEDWVSAEDIRLLHEHDFRAYVLSPELHGRPVDLAKLEEWMQADGIVTDYPALYERILNREDAVVHPQGAWWA
jgi:hypothetical protein